MEVENFIYIFLFVYIYYIYRYSKGLKKAINAQSNKITEFLSFSIIIPFRNESENIPSLISSLKKIDYSSDKFEIIFINDNSSDDSQEVLYKLTKDLSNIRLEYLAKQTGKKNAIQKGVLVAKFNCILTTDADCIIPSKWLQEFNSCWQINNYAAIIGSVKLIDIPDTSLGKFQVLEHNSLQAITIGAGNINPILASGANLAFKKSDYFEVLNEFQKINVVSGDDVFLIQLFNKYKKNIGVIASKGSIISTSAIHSLDNFLEQKTRWGAKTSEYIIPEAKYLASTVLILNASIVALIIYNIFTYNLSSILLSVFFVKLAVDYYIIKRISEIFEQEFYMKNIFWASLIYPFYVTLTGIKSIFSNFEWKGRTHQA